MMHKNRIQQIIQYNTKCQIISEGQIYINYWNITKYIIQSQQQRVAMYLDPQQAQLAELQVQLIPNIHNLDPQVQHEVINILHMICTPTCTRCIISEISKYNLLQEVPLLRSHIWKILLGVLHLEKSTWRQTRHTNQQLYNALKQKFYHNTISNLDLQNNEPPEYITGYQFDLQLWNQIVLDTRRTHSTINFFQTQISFTKVYADKPTKHNDVLTRILYIWSKTNSSVRYVQGMNQILAPLYYLQFQWLNTIHWNRQSQVFALFSAIMGYIIDMHIKQIDDCETGIMGRMIFLNKYLRVVDSELYEKMEKQGIYPQCYSFRWLALMLAQQFGLYDTIRLWDYVFSYEEDKRFFFIYSLCVSILKLRKKQIMGKDLTISLPLIQKLKDMDIQEVIEIGTQLFNKFNKLNINEEYQKIIRRDQQKKINITKAEQIHWVQRRWSYAQIMKNTTNYFTKLTNFNKEQL